MKVFAITLSGMALVAIGATLFSPNVQSNPDNSEVIIYCEPENGQAGYIVCSYDSGGNLFAKEEVDCPKLVGANGEDCPSFIEPPGGEPYPPTHDQ